MNKADLVANIAAKAGLTKKDAEAALNAVVASIEEALVKGDKVALVGFGTFETKTRAARTGINPRTKQAIKIPASKVPAFKMPQDKSLKLSRFIKRKTVANDACDQGRVMIIEKVATPGDRVKEGDIITVTFGDKVLTARVERMVEHVKKDDAAEMYSIIAD